MSLIVYLLYRLVAAIAGLLPLGLVIRGGRALGLLGYFFLPKYRRIALRNLTIAFPEKPLPALRIIAREHFATLTGNLLAGEKIARIPRAALPALITIEGREHIDALIAKKRGYVALVSHIGNWELFAHTWPVIFPTPCGTIYQALGNPHMDAHIRRTRGRLGLALFERKEGFAAAMKMLREGGAVGVLCDQHAGDAGVWCPLFGRLASTTPLPAMFALRTHAAVVPVAMHTDGDRWKLVIAPPIIPDEAEVGAYTAQLNVALEEQIRRAPSDWFWVHNRWKTPRPDFLLVNYKRGIAYRRTTDPATVQSGELFAYAARKAAAPPPLQPFRILVRSSNWLGDAVMTVPALRAIKHGRPDAHLTVLAPAKLAEIYTLVPEVDEVIPFDPVPGRGILRTLRGLFHPFTVARLVKKRAPFEAGVLFPNSIRSAWELWLCGIPRRVGFPGHNPRSWLLNQILREKPRKKGIPAEPPVHQVNHYLKLAEFCGSRAELGLTPPSPILQSPAASGLSDAPESVVVPRIRIGICPGAEYGPAKRWMPERYAEVMKMIDLEYETEWFLVGTAKDRPVAEEIEQLAALPGVRNECGKTTLTELIKLLRTFHVLLTNDTGTMHLAALLGVRTVAIFGSTEPVLTGPLGPGHVVLRHQVECSPCFLRECPIDFRCMKAIEPVEVAAAICSIVDEGVEIR